LWHWDSRLLDLQMEICTLVVRGRCHRILNCKWICIVESWTQDWSAWNSNLSLWRRMGWLRGRLVNGDWLLVDVKLRTNLLRNYFEVRYRFPERQNLGQRLICIQEATDWIPRYFLECLQVDVEFSGVFSFEFLENIVLFSAWNVLVSQSHTLQINILALELLVLTHTEVVVADQKNLQQLLE